MEQVTLGKTGLKISYLGMGGIPIQRSNPEDTTKLAHKMLELGINYIDTARGYTVSESYIGEALKGIREHFVLATKSMARTKTDMAKDIQTSLHNLQTDYIDLYQIHNPSKADLEKVCGKEGALEALIEAREAGNIGHLGLTAHSLDVFELALDLPWVETIMFPYNLVETQAEDLIAECHKRNIGFIVMKPLAGGAIEDRALALRYISHNPNVSVIIPGMYTETELIENIAAATDQTPLSDLEFSRIEEIRKQLGTNFCRRCNYCQPCSADINISSCFLFQGYLERYGLEDWAKERYNAMPVKAGECISCGVCESRCPYHLPIREMLKKCAKQFGA
ncbi:MAG: aldo/keto reductase [Lachnospiraceae bacterium]